MNKWILLRLPAALPATFSRRLATNHLFNGLLAAGIILSLSSSLVHASPADNLIRGILAKDTVAVADAFSRGAGPDSSSRFINWPALMWAVDLGDLRMTAFLLDAGGSVHAREPVLSRTPLLHAAVKGSVEIAELLIGKGASLNDRDTWGWNPIELARRNGHDLLAQYLDRIGNPGTDISRSVFVAVQNRNSDDLKKLNPDRYDLDVCDPERGVTPLMLASVNDDIAMLAVLLAAGASIEFPDHFGNTALMHAAHFGTEEAAAHLLRAGADLNAKNSAGSTPLILAAKAGYENVVRTLIAARADLNIRTRERSFEGWTALMMAAGKNRANVVKILLDAGADAALQSDGRWTAHRIASRNGHSEIVQLLESCGIPE